MDYSRSVGGAALGARLRRLSEAMDGDAARIYADQGAVFEQRWFGVLNQLSRRGPSSVGEIATALRITHASVSQSRRSLKAAGLVNAERDPADARRSPLALTERGRTLVEHLAPLWRAFEAASLELDAEAGGAAAALDRLDDALSRRSLRQRILDHLPGSVG